MTQGSLDPTSPSFCRKSITNYKHAHYRAILVFPKNFEIILDYFKFQVVKAFTMMTALCKVRPCCLTNGY
jgi:hypothetical protein